MIRISQIDDKFSIYKENAVVLLGVGQGTKQILDLMRFNEIDIDYICDNNKDNWGKIFNGIPIISPQHLQQLAPKENVIVQIAVNNIAKSMDEQLKSIGIKAVISFNECYTMLNTLNKSNLIKLSNKYLNDIKNIDSLDVFNKRMEFKNYVINLLDNEILILCSAQKTGNTTIRTTLKNNNINNFNTSHKPCAIDINFINKLDNNIKIITAVREPIIQNISSLYEQITSFVSFERKWIVDLVENSWLENGGEINKVFQIWLDNYSYQNKNLDINNSNTLDIHYFYNSFKENIIDLSQYPFDKEKGYSIIKEGNIEIFVYQLEKMNCIAKEMSDWIGQKPFDNWIRANEASAKWIDNSYKQAQKEIKFSQEYFDNCYNDPWVQHFYSQEDIEKFKTRWRPHIKD